MMQNMYSIKHMFSTHDVALFTNKMRKNGKDQQFDWLTVDKRDDDTN